MGNVIEKCYGDKIKLIEKLIKKEKVPTKNPRALATIMFLTAEWGCGDALAGLILKRLVESNREVLKQFAEKILDKKLGYFSYSTMLTVLDTLAKKYKVFDALRKFGLTGNWKYIEKLNSI